jgi:hypothetical protein
VTRSFSLAALAVAATAFITAGPADARPPVRSVKSTMTAPKGATVSVRLAKGTSVKTVTGGAASGKRGTIAIKAKGTRVTLVSKGAKRPTAFKLGTAACTVKAAGRSGSTAKLAVTCAAQHATGALPLQGIVIDSPAPTANPAATPTPAPTPTPPAPEPYRFAPYVDFSAFPAPALPTISTAAGANHISLGFVVQSNKLGEQQCVPTWGGFAEYPAAGAMPYEQAQVAAFKAAGGDVVVSFGGQAGKELATFCSATDLATQYHAVIDAYRVTHLDFDIEGDQAKNTVANTLRARTIAKLQQANPALVVTYTIQTGTTGPGADPMAVIENAKANGVAIAAVNLMTMDYYENGVDYDGRMGDYAIAAGTALYERLTTLYPSLTADRRWRMIGLTPMTGVNDDPAEVFTLADAQKLSGWASTHHIGMIGMWSLKRDEAGGYAFAKTLGVFTG